jgi:hypothetical protein
VGVFGGQGPLAAKLVPADFNGDGWGDVAVGVPFEDVGKVIDAGAVNVYFGSAKGLKPGQFLRQGAAPVGEVAEANDNFGASLAAGDFDGDGFADLAIGVPNETFDPAKFSAGAVHVLYGTPAGLAAPGGQFWTQDSLGVPDSAEALDDFGWPLAAGDFDGDGFEDLAAADWIETIGDFPNDFFRTGTVTVLHGSLAGLTGVGSLLLTSPGGLHHDGFFGYSLAVGHLGEGPGALRQGGAGAVAPIIDLAVGEPRATVQLEERFPGAYAFFGSSSPFLELAGSRATTVQEGLGKVGGDADVHDQMGFTVAIGAGRALYAGVPRQTTVKSLDGAFHRTLLAPNGSVQSDKILFRPDPLGAAAFPNCLVEIPNAKQTKAGAIFASSPSDVIDGVQSGAGHLMSLQGNLLASLVAGKNGIPGPALDQDSFGWACAPYVPKPGQFRLLVTEPGAKVGALDGAGETHVFSFKNGTQAVWEQVLRQAKAGDNRPEQDDQAGFVVVGSIAR